MNSQLSDGHGLLVELLITFQLVFTIFATCDPKRTDRGGSASLAIGLAVAIGHFFAVSSRRILLSNRKSPPMFKYPAPPPSFTPPTTRNQNPGL